MACLISMQGLEWISGGIVMAKKDLKLSPKNSKNSTNAILETMSTDQIFNNQMQALDKCKKNYGNALKRLANK